jgi:hypothetical protein
MHGDRILNILMDDERTDEIKRAKLLSILARKDEIWKTKDHPELKNGAAASRAT